MPDHLIASQVPHPRTFLGSSGYSGRRIGRRVDQTCEHVARSSYLSGRNSVPLGPTISNLIYNKTQLHSIYLITRDLLRYFPSDVAAPPSFAVDAANRLFPDRHHCSTLVAPPCRCSRGGTDLRAVKFPGVFRTDRWCCHQLRRHSLITYQ